MRNHSSKRRHSSPVVALALLASIAGFATADVATELDKIDKRVAALLGNARGNESRAKTFHGKAKAEIDAATPKVNDFVELKQRCNNLLGTGRGETERGDSLMRESKEAAPQGPAVQRSFACQAKEAYRAAQDTFRVAESAAKNAGSTFSAARSSLHEFYSLALRCEHEGREAAKRTADASAELMKANDLVATVSRPNADLSKAVGQVEAKLADARKAVTEAQQAIFAVEQEIERRDAKIERIEMRLASKDGKDKRASDQRKLKKQLAKLAKAEAKLEAARQQLAAANERVADTEQELAPLQKELAASERQLTAVETRRDGIAEVVAQTGSCAQRTGGLVQEAVQLRSTVNSQINWGNLTKLEREAHQLVDTIGDKIAGTGCH